jgi:hypothetical protein
MRKTLFAAVAVAALTSAATFAIAQDGGATAPRGHHGLFQSDANGDGVVTRQEFDAGRTAMFARIDANNDGQLGADERPHRMHGRGGGHGMRHLANADANNDGRITRDEFLAGPIAHFERLDANDDGALSAEERPQRGERRGGEGRHARMDSNSDGQISQAEFAAMGASMFERMDANDDGRVTTEEADAVRGRHGRH